MNTESPSGLRRIGKALKDSGIVDLAIDLSPAGKVRSIAKVVGRVLGFGDDAPAETVAEMIEAGLTPEQVTAAREAAAREVEAYEETKREELRTEQEAIRAATERLRITSMGDNALSKNWRPIVGYVVMGLFLIDHITWRVSELLGKEQGTNEHLYQITLAVVGFYYGGRTLQHIGSMFSTAVRTKSA